MNRLLPVTLLMLSLLTAEKVFAVQIEQLVEYATSKKSFSVTPQTVGSYFKKVVSLTSEKKGDVWKFTGQNATEGLLWTLIIFQQGEKPNDWELLEADFAVKPEDGHGSTFQALCLSIGKRLDKSQFACGDDQNRRVGWPLRAYEAGSLEEGDFANPISNEHKQNHVTMLKLYILQGDED